MLSVSHLLAPPGLLIYCMVHVYSPLHDVYVRAVYSAWSEGCLYCLTPGLRLVLVLFLQHRPRAASTAWSLDLPPVHCPQGPRAGCWCCGSTGCLQCCILTTFAHSIGSFTSFASLASLPPLQAVASRLCGLLLEWFAALDGLAAPGISFDDVVRALGGEIAGADTLSRQLLPVLVVPRGSVQDPFVVEEHAVLVPVSPTTPAPPPAQQHRRKPGTVFLVCRCPVR